MVKLIKKEMENGIRKPLFNPETHGERLYDQMCEIYELYNVYNSTSDENLKSRIETVIDHLEQREIESFEKFANELIQEYTDDFTTIKFIVSLLNYESCYIEIDGVKYDFRVIILG